MAGTPTPNPKYRTYQRGEGTTTPTYQVGKDAAAAQASHNILYNTDESLAGTYLTQEIMCYPQIQNAVRIFIVLRKIEKN